MTNGALSWKRWKLWFVFITVQFLLSNNTILNLSVQALNFTTYVKKSSHPEFSTWGDSGVEFLALAWILLKFAD